MSEREDPDLTRLLRDLTRELQTLQREVENRDRRSVSTRRQLSEFTSEVAIPGLILLLETNIRALKLLRRAIRLADGRNPRESRSDTAGTALRDRAERLGSATLSRLDETLAELQSSLEDRGDDDVRAMVAEARELQEEIRQRIDEASSDRQPAASAGDREPGPESDLPGSDDHVAIDVESELQTLKDDIEDGPEGSGAANGGGNDAGADDEGGDGSDGDTDSGADGADSNAAGSDGHPDGRTDGN
jgi:hypothetical protein